ncbi:hypothetical protein Tcan_18325 [Toxocara canis]|uniref:Uncharacterized protein n=2 Tax=Toxocara canis TaxID=6265 RepID=A0A0B2V237_TOXCA|nr:hypothetical protein Tcan_18325 [Toxocara canis]VDM47794.1 unnamed protein product [Toxocara canis]
MIESFGTKLFKSITATADEIGSKFELVFTNFSDAITEDADDLVIEVISLSNLTRIVLCILIVLLVLIILKYVAFGINYVQWQLQKRCTTTTQSNTEIFMLAVPVEIDSENRGMVNNDLHTAYRLQTGINGRQLLNPMKVFSTIHVSKDQPSLKTF